LAYPTSERDPLLDPQTRAFVVRSALKLAGFMLLVLGLAVVAMAVSYSPDDPNWMVSTDAPVQNWLGVSGARIAAPMFMVVGWGVLSLALLIGGWGVRLMMHAQANSVVMRLVFIPFAVTSAAVYASTLVPGPAWGDRHFFGLGGQFGDMISHSVLLVLPISSHLGIKIASAVFAAVAVGLHLFALGVTTAELKSIGRFMHRGLRVCAVMVLTLLGRTAQMSHSKWQARQMRRDEAARDLILAQRAAQEEAEDALIEDWPEEDWPEGGPEAGQENGRNDVHMNDRHDPNAQPAQPAQPTRGIMGRVGKLTRRDSHEQRSDGNRDDGGIGDQHHDTDLRHRAMLDDQEMPMTELIEPDAAANLAAYDKMPGADRIDAKIASAIRVHRQRAEHLDPNFETGPETFSETGPETGTETGPETGGPDRRRVGDARLGGQFGRPAGRVEPPLTTNMTTPIQEQNSVQEIGVDVAGVDGMTQNALSRGESRGVVTGSQTAPPAVSGSNFVATRDPQVRAPRIEVEDVNPAASDRNNSDRITNDRDSSDPVHSDPVHSDPRSLNQPDSNVAPRQLSETKQRDEIAAGPVTAPPPPVRKPVTPAPRADVDAQPEAGFSAPDGDAFVLPPLSLLSSPDTIERHQLSSEALQENARMLESVLDDYGVKGQITSVRPGPVVTMYELEPAAGLKASRVIGLSDDIARSMSALSARVSTVPGRSVIGIELPNVKREKVVLREILAARDFGDGQQALPLALGKDIGGGSVVADLAKMPHLLIAGTTGSGKSVAINTMILSLLYKLTPSECRLIMIDPKMLELSVYDGIPHLLSPVVTDPKKAVVSLKWVVGEMEDRYRKMSKMGVRNISGYNGRVKDALAKDELFSRTVQTGFDDETGDPVFETDEFAPEVLPYIVVVVDEMADLMMVAGKEIEACIQRLAQMARASGIHLIMATQRPSVDVITGTIKANFPTRISFQVTSKIDSRTILGEMGAEQLLGMGDMLYMAGGAKITRCHGPFVSDEEVEEIVNHLKAFGPPSYVSNVVDGPDEARESELDAVLGLGGNTTGTDALYDQAVAIVARDRKCSTSYIQRKLGIGYNKAARLVEQMEDEHVVSSANHVGKREILLPETGD
jgi:S-DNA-T family DNA segregation ATPase FtsK/SpoIIIE